MERVTLIMRYVSAVLCEVSSALTTMVWVPLLRAENTYDVLSPTSIHWVLPSHFIRNRKSPRLSDALQETLRGNCSTSVKLAGCIMETKGAVVSAWNF